MRSNIIRRCIAMLGGIFIMGLGVALFRFSGMGNDPATAMNFAASDRSEITLSIVMIRYDRRQFPLVLPAISLRMKTDRRRHVRELVAMGPLITFFSGWLASYRPAPQTFSSRQTVMGAAS